MSREPVTIFELDVPRCSRTYGSSPCTASLSADNPAKCFNMPQVLRADGTTTGCQDPANYDGGTYTLRYATNISGLLKSEQIYPALVGEISGAAQEVTVAPTDKYTGVLGRRETLTVTLNDFKDNDTGLDPYQSERLSGAALFSGVGYDPETRGTHFARLFRRWPYWQNAACRVLRGYIGDALVDFTVEHFVLTEVDGPDARGQVRLKLRDELNRVTEDKYIPAPSNGKLADDIGTGLTAFDLTPSGVGSEYAASGRICIGTEIMTFTRSGDTITPTARGVDGSTVASHSTDDTVQECARFEDQTIDEVAVTLLEAAGVASARIPSTDYAAEVDEWLTSFRLTRTIAKPQLVSDVVSSLLRCFGFFFWWDREDREIKLRANRPVGVDETVPTMDGALDFLAGSFGREVLDDQRYTDILYWHGVIDYTKGAEDPDNYRTADVARDGDASDADQYGEAKILSIYNPWLGQVGDFTTAIICATRLLFRFRNAPVRISGVIDREKVAELALAGPVSMTLRTEQEDDGSTPARLYQLVRDQRQPGERNSITLESYDLTGRFGFITEDSAPDYDSATTAEREDGCWISEDASPYGVEPPYQIW